MQSLPPALAALAARDQFVCWYAEPNPKKPGKFSKIPCHWATGQKTAGGATGPENWTSAAQALASAPAHNRGHGSGAGYVFTGEDPFFFLDIDGAWDPDKSAWSDLAQGLLAALPGCAVEVSHSGLGLHVFGTYDGPEPDHAKKNTPKALELYTSKRFVALTGTHAQGDAGQSGGPGFASILAAYFPPTPTGDADNWTNEPVPEWKGPADDADLIAKACASGQRSATAVFGGGEGKPSFADLWEGRPEPLARNWPQEDSPTGYGRTEADQSLANHLAFWTGKDCERMERLMRQSALARDKWDNHRTYLTDTIVKACAFVGKVATGRQEAPPPVVVPPAAPEAMADAAAALGRTLRGGLEYMGPIDQLAHFAGCYFLANEALVFSLTRDAIMKKATFDVVFGGHMFVMDPMGQKTTTSAWEAFTQSRVNAPVIVDDLCFRPELPSGTIVTEGRHSLVNSYVPYFCPLLEGDPEPFLDLLRRLLPVDEDRRILVNYLASFAQNPGRKFQWWPVLQGTKGNGKTLIVWVMRFIAGEHYSHLPNAHAMARDGMKFNSWVHRKTFIGVEEISLQNKRDFLDEFKVIVTNERIPLEGKGTNQVTGDNRANGILCTNFRDGVPVDADERRYAIFYTAQQCEADLYRDGMGGEYFPALFAWFRRGGAGVIANYLKAFAIEAAYDPAGSSHRAPKTSSSRAAVTASLGSAEQEIQEAIDEGRPGFAGGWVSSKFLDALLERIRRNVPRNKRPEMMERLGYVQHPALAHGRTNAIVMPDNGKPVLYVRRGHIVLNVDSAAEVARLYTAAQDPAVQATSPAVIAFGG